MPRFPKAERYESSRQLTTEQPSVLAPADADASILEQTAKVGQGLQNVSEKLTSALITVQKTTAEKNFKVGMERILTNVENDPDYNNSDQHYKDIEKLKTESLKGFKFPGVKRDMEIQLGFEADIGKIKVENLFKKKMVDVGRASAQELLDLEAKSPSENSETNIKNIIDEQVSAGIFSREEGYKIQQKAIKDMKQNAFIADLNADPAQAEKNLEKNVYQFDIKELDSAKGVYEKEVKKIQAVTENDLLTSYLNGEEIDTLAVKQLLNENKIDATFAESLINKIENPKPDAVSKDEFYIEFQNKSSELLENKDKVPVEDLLKFMSGTMEAHAKGLLDKSDFERVFKALNETIQKKIGGKAEEIMTKVRPKTLFERLSFWVDEYADKEPEIKARLYRNLVDGMAQGADGLSIVRKVIDDEIELQMQENLNAPSRSYAINPDTKQRIYSEDGGATWKDEKTGKEIK